MRYNDGMVFTNDNCIGCNRCIAECPVPGSNVAVIKNGKNRIDVSSSKCIHCGRCLSVCSHNAREYVDHLDEFLESLQNKEEVSLIVAPSFYVLYADQAKRILGYLRALGVKKIYDAGFGAEISLWAHVNYLKQPGGKKAFIAQTCPTIVNYAERCLPELLDYIIPVQSPVCCTAIYVKKYLKDNAKLAFLNPCISKKDEIEANTTHRLISYSLTYAHLMNHLEGVQIDQYDTKSDLETLGPGRLLPIAGSFQECVSSFFPKDKYTMHYNGLNKQLISVLKRVTSSNNNIRPFFADILGCDNGCLTGTGINHKDYDSDKVFFKYRALREETYQNSNENLTPEENFEKINQVFSNLSLEDFKREFEEQYKQPHMIPESTYDEIFQVMHMDTEEKRNINCRSCGYASCRDMVEAIAYGYGKMENCVHYVNDELKHQLLIDAKTKLPNTISFPRDCSKLMEQHPDRQYVICVCNVNRYKLINDLYDYSIGDQVLEYLVKYFREFTEGNGACAYFGGGNFAVCFENNEENMNRLVSKEYFECRHIHINFPITMRFGLFICSDPTISIERAVNLAALTMDRVKDRSRNSYAFYTDEMRQEILTDAAVTAQMHSAMKNGEFTLYLQPQYNHSTKEMVGAEALCRWIKADGTIISPAVFIPIFEKNGFIKEFDRFIWEETFLLVRNLLDHKDITVPISVNISRISLLDDEIVHQIKRLQELYRIPTELLHFEITESAYIEKQEQLIERVKGIRDIGFNIAMDDFGAGYSSLNVLKDVPIDILKLDMGFIRGDSNMERGGNIISSVIRMAHSLELVTIAEGVETEEQADFLKSVGCDLIQGYLYARPMPVKEFERLINHTKNKNRFIKPRIFENMNINSFFNPKSGETLMFENYSGAAAVFEYDHEKLTAIRINSKLLETLGYGEVSFREFQLDFLRMLEPEEREKLFLAIKQAIGSNAESVCVTKHRLEGGSYVWVKSHIWKIGIVGEKYIIYLLAENITTERESQMKLAGVVEQMKIVIDNSLNGVCLFQGTALNTRAMRYLKLQATRTNRTFLELSGYTEEEVKAWTEKEALGIIHPLDKLDFIIKMRHAMEHDFSVPTTHTFRVRQKNGDYLWVKMMATGVKKPDGTFWLVTNFINHTEEKKRES